MKCRDICYVNLDQFCQVFEEVVFRRSTSTMFVFSMGFGRVWG